MQIKKKEIYAELDAPGIVCGKCRYMSSLQGEWLSQEGHLVFVCDPDPQPRRGPDLFTCGECGSEFHHVSTDWNSKRLDDSVLAAVRETAQKVREAEWADLGLACEELCGVDEAGLSRLQGAR